MRNDFKEILISEEKLQERIRELGKQITEDYKGEDSLVMVCVLKGAVMFMVDLAKNIDMPVTMDFMAVSSYGMSTESSGVVRILKDLDEGVEGKNVLVVEDIVDSGLTLKYLIENLEARNPKSVKVCSLLDKPEGRNVNVKFDYKGFDVPNEFVVGYGIDFAEKYRNLPYIGILKREMYEK